MDVSFYTLGCKVNQYESLALAHAFEERGYRVVPFSSHADVVCVNTCAVTEESERKSRQIVRRARTLHPDAVVVAVGCMTQASGEADGADVVLGNADKMTVPDAVEAFLRTRERLVRVLPVKECRRYEDGLNVGGERTRATVKIEDGCQNFCSYCLIPYLRGPVRSRDPKDALDEIQGLVAGGYREIVLTGIHLDSYGKDLQTVTLVDFLERVDKIPGLLRVRLGSLEPVFLTEENLERLAKLKTLCPQFHLSLQSGCDRTLNAMHRHYTTAQYRHALALIRAAFPVSAVTTDVIVGFPGETDEDFAASLSFVKECRFAKVHVFPFSARKGTLAYRLPDPVPPDVKKARTQAMLAAANEAEQAFLHGYVGKTVEVLFETEKKGYTSGYTKEYASVTVQGGAALQNTVGNVLITGVEGDSCVGTLQENGGNSFGKEI